MGRQVTGSGRVQLVAEAGDTTEEELAEAGVLEVEVDTQGPQGVRLLGAEVATQDTQGIRGLT